MKLTPKTLTKLIGLGAGAFFGGPVFACLGSTCGGFIGEMFDGDDESGWELDKAFSGVLGNLFAGKLQPMFEDVPSGFNHDLRRAAAHALVAALEWEKKPGPLSVALLKTSPFSVLSSQRKELLKRLILRWRDHIAAVLKAAEKNKDSSLLDAILPRGDSDAFTRLTDDKLTAEEHTTTAWAAFYQQTLQPVLDAIMNQDERQQFDHADLQKHVTASLAAVFPACFTEALKSPDQKRAWIAYQKTVLSAIQRCVYDIGGKTKRIPEIEKKIDVLVENAAAAKQSQLQLSEFLAVVQPAIDGQWQTTKKTHLIVTAIQEHLGAFLAEYQKIAPLSLYKEAVFDAYAHYVEVGLPKTGGTSFGQRRALIGDIFVDPCSAAARVTPAQLDDDIESKRQLPGAALLPVIQDLFTSGSHRRLVLLGDPGMGKSTLVRWLTVSPLLTGTRKKLTSVFPTSLPACLKSAIPLPFVIRDLVLHMPDDAAQWDWDALVSAFREFRATDSAVRPLLSAYSGNEPAFESLLADPDALFLIDGLDEIGDSRKRTAMSAAIREGFKRLPHARFLVTSRIIGYDDAPVDWMVTRRDEGSAIVTKAGRDAMVKMLVDKSVPQEEAETIDPRVASSHTTEIRVATRLFLTPFNNQQQEKYALRWFTVRVGEKLGQDRATALLNEARRKKSIRVISRVPNLLCMMALLKTHDVPLPDGRAELYADISTAYLKTIHEARHLNDPHHGHHLPCTQQEAEKWLSIIAMRLRVQSAEVSNNKASRFDIDKPSDSSDEILATQAQMLGWLEPMLAEDRCEETAETLLHDFLRYITQRAAFLLERGEGQYGFAHLSFLEYYAARWMADEVDRLLKHRQPEAWQQPELILSDSSFEQLSRQPAWHEPLHFLAEIITSHHRADTLSLLAWTFPWFPWKDLGTTMPAPSDTAPDLHAASLLVALTLDKKVSLTLLQRTAIWSWLWKRWLAEMPEDVLSKAHPWHLAPTMLDVSDFQAHATAALTALLPGRKSLLLDNCSALTALEFIQAAADLKQLCLMNCTGLKAKALTALQGLGSLQKLALYGCTDVSDLTSLQDLGSLQTLSLHGCTGVSDLAGLRGLGNLRKLHLNGCMGVSDLAAIQNLGSLRTLDLTRCTGVSDLTALQSLGSLQMLDLTRCTGVSDLSALQDLGSLQTLSLTGCTGVSDLAGLKGLGSLQSLNLNRCTGVSDLTALKGLGSLQTLSLNGCTNVNDLTALQDLGNLQTLSLTGCTGVSDLAGLQGLGSLRELDLSGCSGVSDLSALQDLGNLQTLSLTGCTGVSALAGLQGLGSLQSLDLNGCTGLKDMERQIAELQKELPECEIHS